MTVSVSARRESWPIRGTFRISRGWKTSAEVIVVTLCRGGHSGRGECVPYRRYGETLDGVEAAIASVAAKIEGGADREALQALLPRGAARNALDCALWDLEAKESGQPAWRIAGIPEPKPVITSVTITLDEPGAMAAAALRLSDLPLLKLKVGREGIVERVAAVRAAAPNARLVVDANEAWTISDLASAGPRLMELGVELIEQPLPAGADDALADFSSPIPLCADESIHDRGGLARAARLYAYVNIKLDKAGGLTEALRLAGAAERAGLGIMVGCMVGTSLAMAPAALLGGHARYVDLDGPLLLAKDREPGLEYEQGWLHPPSPGLWG